MILPSMCDRSSACVVQPRIAGHDRAGRRRARILHVEEVPRVRVLAADAVQVRPGALRAPQERMVVDELAGLASTRRSARSRSASAGSSASGSRSSPRGCRGRGPRARAACRAGPPRSSGRWSARAPSARSRRRRRPARRASVSTANCVGPALERAVPGAASARRTGSGAAAAPAPASSPDRARPVAAVR